MRNDLTIADNRPDVAFALSLEISAASSAMVSVMEGLYQVPVDLSSDRFHCSSAIHAKFVTETNVTFARVYAACKTDDDREHLSGRLAELCGRVPVLNIKRTKNAVPREEVKRNSVDDLLLGVVERVENWPDYDVED